MSSRALTGLLRAQAWPQAGEKGTTGQPRGALTGLLRAWPPFLDRNGTIRSDRIGSTVFRGRHLAGEPA